MLLAELKMCHNNIQLIEFITLNEWVVLETMLLAHAHSIITTASLPLRWYRYHWRTMWTRNLTDLSEEPFSDEEDGAAV